MGLITKEVEITLGANNFKRYELLGYDLPKVLNNYGKYITPVGTILKVKVEDLSKWSEALVDVECDMCHELLHIQYNSYVRHNHDGKTYCKDCGRKLFQTKENHWNWNANKTDEERLKNRDIHESKVFTQKVMIRDNYTCQCCGQKHGNIIAHHLDGWDWCIDKRFDETNGITLCDTCHKNFHHIHGYGGNTKEQFEKWIGYAIGKLEKYGGKLPTAKRIMDMDNLIIIDSANEVANSIKTLPTYVYDCCNKKCTHCKGRHFLWLHEYEQMSEKDIEEYWDWVYNATVKKVICLETLQIYQDANKAARAVGLKAGSCILQCCKGRQKSAGKLPDGTKLHWMYYQDYLKLSNKEKQELENKYKIKNIESEVA